MLVDLSRPVWKPSLSSCAILPLYVKSPSYSGVGDGTLTVGAHNYADFMTYFGAFSLKKWRRYTGIDDLTPTLIVETSAPVHITLTEMIYRRLEKRVICESDHAPSQTQDGWYRYTIAYPKELDAQLVAFTITTNAYPATVRNAAYYADLPSPQETRIEIITTTYRKERQVARNIELIRKELLDNGAWGDHFRLTVVDNGRTLSEAVCADNPAVTLIPNGNVGGAGGFAAGMLHAVESGWTTHVLLMDDDVTVCPESFKRSLRLLEYAGPEYREATIAGAMLSTANFEMQQEDIGVITPERNLRPFKPRLIMDREYDISFNEELIPASDADGLYSAWWYSCFPARRITDYGLPIPLFYRRDDVEYATRIQEKEPLKFVTINGVCVWHDAFDLRWNAAVEVYLATRNMLIQEAFTPDPHHSMSAMIQLMRDNVINHGRRFDYASMELTCDAIEDYLRGPDYYRRPVGEDLFRKARDKAERLTPLEEIPDAPDAIDIFALELNANDENVEAIEKPDIPDSRDRARLMARVRRRFRRVLQRGETVEAHPIQERPISDDKMVIIPNDGWCRPWRILHDAGKALAVDTTGRHGALRVRDEARNGQLRERFERLAQTLLDDTDVRQAYRKCRDEMTSFEFWHTYLEEAKR